jgi:uncharacterized membrane protein
MAMNMVGDFENKEKNKMDDYVVVALYDNLEDAKDAVEELHARGFLRDNISLIANDVGGKYARRLGKERDLDEKSAVDTTAEGAGLGAITGGLAGLLLGLSALAVPGIGPVLAAGPLVAGLVGAGIGAATGGLLGALVEAGVPEEEAHYYAEGIRRGGTLVAVNTTQDNTNEAVDILDSYDPVDIERRAGVWRDTEWTGFDSSAADINAEEVEQHRIHHEELEGYEDNENLYKDEDWTPVAVYRYPEEKK